MSPGVQVGIIGGVTLKNGMADVQLDIDPQYKRLIHQDATALLRPKTGLKDMFIEVDPGSSSSPVAKPGYTIPVSNTNPDVDVDEILGSLDADTRSYLQLLINGAGEGLQGKGASSWPRSLSALSPPTATWPASTRPWPCAGATWPSWSTRCGV